MQKNGYIKDCAAAATIRTPQIVKRDPEFAASPFRWTHGAAVRPSSHEITLPYIETTLCPAIPSDLAYNAC